MDKLTIPDRITWVVDLTRPEEELFSATTLKRVKAPIYAKLLECEVLSAGSIKDRFLPMYERLLMERPDYRLDKEKARKRICQISQKDEYKLFWVSLRENGAPLGGVVFRILSDKGKVSYRVFDHQLAKRSGLKDMDYYVEVEVDKYMRDLNLRSLSHGSDVHPVTQIGLSMFKMRIGARPRVASKSVLHTYTEEEWQKKLNENKCVGYYFDPDPINYRKFRLFGETDASLLGSFVRVADRSGVTVVVG